MAVTMSDSKEVRVLQLSSLGYLSHNHVLPLLQLLSIALLSGLLVAILIQGSKVLSSQRQTEINQKLTQLKAGVHHLCCPCPWDWMFFQGNCYFFSKTQWNWRDSVTACQEVGAQLVIIKCAEEQRLLQKIAKNNGLTWMGLSDLEHEGTWQWVDGSPLSLSFTKYWNEGGPNNAWNEDCAEFKGNGWNDAPCKHEKFWICKKPAVTCSSQ